MNHVWGCVRLVVVCVVLSPVAAAVEIADCEATDGWRLGGSDPKAALTSVADGVGGKRCLKLDFTPRRPGLDHVVLKRDGPWDLSAASRLEFWVKAVAPDCRFLLTLTDDQGQSLARYFRPEQLLEDPFTPRWRRVRIALDGEDVKLNRKRVMSLAVTITDYLDTGRNVPVRVLLDAFSATTGRPDPKRPLRLPPEMRPAADGTFDMLVIGRDTTPAVAARWGWDRLLQVHRDGGRLDKVTYEYRTWWKKGRYEGFPDSYKGLARYELLVATATDTEAMLPQHQALLVDYVEAGGALLVVGGYESFSSRLQSGSLLGDLLPIRPTKPWNLVPTTSGLIQGADRWKPPAKADAQRVAFLRLLAARDGAETWLRVDELPLLVTWTYGRGRVAALAATVLGPENTRHAFWRGKSYVDLMRAITDWLTEPQRGKRHHE